MSFILSKEDQIRSRIIMLIDERVEMVNQSMALTPGSDERTIVPTYIVHPPLLVQLASAVAGSTAGVGGSGGASKPAANLVPIDTLNLIKEEAAAWVRYYFRQPAGKVGENLRLIHERVSAMNDGEDLRQLDAESKHWVALALVTTTWDKAPMKPYISCPNCSTLASIQVRVEPICAVCLECRATWDETSIDLLGAVVQALPFKPLNDESDPRGEDTPNPLSSLPEGTQSR